MRLTDNTVVLLTTAALTLTASAASVDVTTAAAGPFGNIKASKGAWDRLSKYCGKGTGKRDLFSSAVWPPPTPPLHTYVPMGDSKAERDPLGLWTYGLVTCFGVGVTGAQSDKKKNERVLMHYGASQAMADSQWASFKTKVDAAGLANKRGYLSIPDTSKELFPGSSKEDKDLSDQLAAVMKKQLQALVGANPIKVVVRATKPALDQQLPAGTMAIDSKNQVTIEGRIVT